MSDPIPPVQRKQQAGNLFGYRIRRKIGDGAWSRVYEVEDVRTHTAYALKHVISEGEKQDRYLDQLRAEWEIGRRLDHPAIRKLVDLKGDSKVGKLFGARSNELGLVMELIDATPLSDQPRPPMAQCLRVFADVAAGMLHMHLKGFVHTDMKPLNILYDPELQQTKIIDLGQAVKAGTKKPRLQGSAGFIAPEQARELKDGEEKLYEPVTEATDVFNLAATMYWILLRVHAPQSQHSSNKGLILPPERLGTAGPVHLADREIPETLSTLILECLDKVPGKRKAMPTVARVLDELATAAEAKAGMRQPAKGGAR